jgi:hypothetical protein
MFEGLISRGGKNTFVASLALSYPILPGKTEAAKKLFEAIKTEKWKEFDQSQRRSGIKKERDFLQTTPIGDMVILYMESDDFQRAFTEFGNSKDPFDMWLKQELKDISGIDFSEPAPGTMPQELMTYDS